MATSTEKETVAELLAKLSEQGNQGRESGPVSDKRLELQRTYPPVNRVQLMGIFAKSDRLDLRLQNAFIYGPAVMDAGYPLLPVVTINARFRADGASWISVYVMSWVFCRRRWSVLPIRFERPPHDQMDGAHGYNHAQFFWSLFDNGKPLVDGENIKWLPQKQPAIPLPAISHTPAVVAAAIVSLYGAIGARPYVSDLQTTDFPFVLQNEQPSQGISRRQSPGRRRG